MRVYSLQKFDESHQERGLLLEDEGLLFKVYFMNPNSVMSKYVSAIQTSTVKVNSKNSSLILGNKESKLITNIV